MLQEQGLEVVPPMLVNAGADPADAARIALAQGAQILVAAGGDGTVNAVASAIVDSDASLGVLPLGTLNHFARDLQIPLTVEAAVRVIAAGQLKHIDVGDVNGRIFINNSSLGIYPRIVSWREQKQRMGLNKWVALFWAAILVVRRTPLLQVRLSANGREVTRLTPLVFMGNNEYEIDGFRTGTRRCLDAGRLFVYVANAVSGKELIGLALRVLFGRVPKKTFDALLVTEARIETRRSHLMVSFDGEVARMKTPLHYRVRPAALRVLVP